MKQLAIGSMIYADDNRGILPHNGGQDPASGQYWIAGTGDSGWDAYSKGNWYQKLPAWEAERYSGTAFICPQANPYLSPLDISGSHWNNATTTYAISNTLGGHRTGTVIPRVKSLKSKRYWFGEAGGYWQVAKWRVTPFLDLNRSTAAWANDYRYKPWAWVWAQFRSSGHPEDSLNWLMGDGHVMPLSFSTFYFMSLSEKRSFDGADGVDENYKKYYLSPI